MMAATTSQILSPSLLHALYLCMSCAPSHWVYTLRGGAPSPPQYGGRECTRRKDYYSWACFKSTMIIPINIIIAPPVI